MPKLFISYRRDDTEWATGRIYERLKAHFGKDEVYFDIATIPAGVDFVEHLTQAVSQCDVLLAMIGDQWLDARSKDGSNQGQRRLENPDDFVRIEIEAALKQNIPVIPVLLGKTAMPGREQLPTELNKLSTRSAAIVSPGRDFDHHVDGLIGSIEYLLLPKRNLQKEGEAKLTLFVRETLDRTQGKPTKDDTAAANEMCKRHHIDKDRAKQIVEEVREQWQKAHPPKLERKPGEIITNNLGMKFAWIPPGTFLMGSPKTEAERSDNETQHKVTLSKGFFMGVHLVTQEQWQTVMGNNPSNFKGEKNLPVEQVSWNDWQEFLKKLREKDKKAYRLPSEAEWEYACRAGTTKPFHFGGTISTDQANYNGNYTYGDGKKGKYREKTTPVGSFPANAYGLFDTHGNLFEWCQDWLGDYPQNDVVDPQGPDAGQYRVLRGGS
jgi:formylglycine-generating enzyme required for sulfatase activity